MADITITHTGSILGRKVFRIQRQLPDTWADLSPGQVWRCIDLLMTHTERIPVLRYLLDLPPFILASMSRAELYDILRCISWMEIDQRATAPAAPYIDLPRHTIRHTPGREVLQRLPSRLYLPCAEWANVVGMEYALVDDLYHQYLEASPADAQDIQERMIAIILRPAGPSDDPHSDPRTRLVSLQQTETWLSVVRSISPGIKAYITLLISANIQHIHDSYQRWLFPQSQESDDSSDLTASSGTGDLGGGGLNFGWWGAFMDVASDGIFGDLDRVHQTPIHTICMHLIRQVERARQTKIEHQMAAARMRR